VANLRSGDAIQKSHHVGSRPKRIANKQSNQRASLFPTAGVTSNFPTRKDAPIYPPLPSLARGPAAMGRGGLMMSPGA